MNKFLLSLCLVAVSGLGYSQVTDFSNLEVRKPLHRSFVQKNGELQQEAPVLAKTLSTVLKGQETVNLTCALLYEKGQAEPERIYAFGYDGSVYEGELSEDATSASFLVPAGNYEFVALFEVIDEQSIIGYSHDAFVILENIEVAESTSLEFDVASATNHVHFSSVDTQGEVLSVSTEKYDDEGNRYQSEAGNAEDMIILRTLLHEEMGPMISTWGTTGSLKIFPDGKNLYLDGERLYDFFVNDVSDKYSFEQFRHVYTPEGDSYVCNLRTRGAKEDVDIVNTADSYTLDLSPAFSPASDAEAPYGLTLRHIYKGRYPFMGYCTLFENEKIHTLNISLGTAEDKIDGVDYGFVFYYQMNKDGGIGVSSPLYMLDDEKGEFIPGQTISSLYMQNGADGIDDFPVYPGPEALQYSFYNTNRAYGSTCPIFTGAYTDYEYYGYVMPIITFSPVGRLGENFEGKYPTTVRINGEISADRLLDLTEWQYDMMMNNPGEAHYNIVMENHDVKIDGLSGSNIMTLDFDKAREDWCPPMLTALQIRDRDGMITDEVSNPQETAIIIMGGDFNQVNGEFNYEFDQPTIWYEYSPALLKVEAAPFGTDEYTQLEMAADTSYDDPNVFGGFYQGTLEGLVPGEKDQWYDLRITFTDTSGNWQQQVVSPAFKLLGTSSVNSTYVDNSDASIVAIYDLAGNRLSDYVKGINIVKLKDGTTRKVVIL